MQTLMIDLKQYKIKFRFICHNCNIQKTYRISYNNILKTLKLDTLKIRRHLLYNMFFLKLLTNKIDDSFLLNQLNFKVDNHYIHNSQFYMSIIFSKKARLLEIVNCLNKYCITYVIFRNSELS